MSRVKVQPKGRHARAVRLNKEEREMSRRGRTVAVGAAVALLIIIVGMFLYIQVAR